MQASNACFFVLLLCHLQKCLRQFAGEQWLWQLSEKLFRQAGKIVCLSDRRDLSATVNGFLNKD